MTEAKQLRKNLIKDASLRRFVPKAIVSYWSDEYLETFAAVILKTASETEGNHFLGFRVEVDR
jgi:hypothetical protein